MNNPDSMINYMVIIPIAIASVILVAAFYPSLLLLAKYHSIDIVGTVKFRDSSPHSFYIFTPEQTEMGKLKEIGADQSISIVLWGGELRRELVGEKVRIQGTFVEDYDKYLSEIFRSRLSAMPSGPVIIVKNIEILS